MDGLARILAEQRQSLLSGDLSMLEQSSAQLAQTLGALAGVLGNRAAPEAGAIASALQVNRELLMRRQNATQRGLAVLFPPAPTYSAEGVSSSPLAQVGPRPFSKA